MTGRTELHECALLVLATLLGCRPAPAETPPPPATAPAVEPASAPPEPAPVVAEQPACRPAAAEPPIAAGAPGPAYVLVEHVGVVRIDVGEATTVVPLAKGAEAGDFELAASPSGALWLSSWKGVDVLAPDGTLRNILRTQGGSRYESLQVRADDDVWAVTSASEWQIVHYDGSRWKPVRGRDKFPGPFSDNKFAGLALTSEAVWVSSSNGLWRLVGKDWQQIDKPVENTSRLHLLRYRDRLLAGDHAHWFVREGASWRALAWPQTTSVLRAVGDVGLVAAAERGEPTVKLTAVTAASCTATSEPLAGTWVSELAVDGSGRVWLATDAALAVLDGDGRKLAEWTAGTLPGLSGRIAKIVVIGGGPQRLPAPQPARKWEVVGRLTTYKSSAPLANAALELCPSPAREDRCPPGPFVRTATSAADGSFRFADVAAGDYSIVVRPPAGNPDCEGIFSDVGHGLAPARDCPGDSSRCDLGTLEDCRPFEMPPPH